MKSSIKSGFTLLIITMSLICCNKSADPAIETEEQIFLSEIAKTWKSSVVMLDGVDVSKSFSGLVVTFSSDKTITVTNPLPPMWKESGSFDLQSNGSTFLIKRNDGLNINVVEATDQRLVLNFQYDPSAINGRVKSVVGNFTFEMIQ
jgi:hypothetical protein